MKNLKNYLIIALSIMFGSAIYSQAPTIIPTQLYLQFDDHPEQISWELTGPGGAVKSGGNYALSNANNLIRIPLDEAGDFGVGASFTFTIKDSGNDGLSGGAWAINTGSIALLPPGFAGLNPFIGRRIVNGTTGFGAQTQVTFQNTDRPDVASGPAALANITVGDISRLLTPVNVNIRNLRAASIAPGRSNLLFFAQNSGRVRVVLFRLQNGRTRTFRRVITVNGGRNTVVLPRRPSGNYLARVIDLTNGNRSTLRFRIN